MIKRVSCLLFIICLMMMLFSSAAYSVSTATYNVNLYEGGRIDITGNISAGAGKQVTFLAAISGVPVNSTTIVFIDQGVSTTNGTFLFRFTLPTKWRGATLDFSVGGEGLDSTAKKDFNNTRFPYKYYEHRR